MQNMDTVLLDRILEVMTQEEKESVLSRLKTDPASYHAMQQKLDLKKETCQEQESIEELAGEITEELREYQPLSRDFTRFCQILLRGRICRIHRYTVQ